MTLKVSEFVQRMVAAGASPDVIAIAVEYVESTLSAERLRTSADSPADKRRKQDRERKRLARQKSKQNGHKAVANDAALSSGQSADINAEVSADEPILRCDLSSLPVETIGKVKKEKSAEPRARGTRLPKEAVLSEANYQFAVASGVSNPGAAWDEFVDYWTSIPGQRGTKLDWDATWRNRVRMLASKKGKSYGNGNPKSDWAATLEHAGDYVASGHRGTTPVSEDDGPHRH